MKGLVRRRIVEPLLAQLRQGITPEKLALTLALGLALGSIPVLGVTTVLCAAAGVALRLNQPAIQVANYAAYPLQLALFVPFFQAGAWLLGAEPVSFSLSQVRAEPLRQKEAAGGTVTAITIGGEGTKEALKHALAMGADDAILISDPALENLDTQAVARVLAAAIQKIGGVDMVFFGRQAIDGDSGLVPEQTARLLGWPSLTLSAVIQVENGAVKVEPSVEEGRQTVKAKLPAVFSIAKDFGEPRYPSVMGIRKASKATIPVWSLADLGLSAPAAVVRRTELMNPPVQETTIEIISGESPAEIADKLVDKILAEQVL